MSVLERAGSDGQSALEVYETQESVQALACGECWPEVGTWNIELYVL